MECKDKAEKPSLIILDYDGTILPIESGWILQLRQYLRPSRRNKVMASDPVCTLHSEPKSPAAVRKLAMWYKYGPASFRVNLPGVIKHLIETTPEPKVVAIVTASSYLATETVANENIKFQRFSSCVHRNLKGRRKLEIFSEEDYSEIVYVGNSENDLEICPMVDRFFLICPRRTYRTYFSLLGKPSNMRHLGTHTLPAKFIATIRFLVSH